MAKAVKSQQPIEPTNLQPGMESTAGLEDQFRHPNPGDYAKITAILL
ncbi:MAG: hypothetical protein ABFS39_16635 [Pseudomonadota bacterium]